MHQQVKCNAMVEITNATRVSLVGLKLVIGRIASVSVTHCVREIQTNVTVHLMLCIYVHRMYHSHNAQWCFYENEY